MDRWLLSGLMGHQSAVKGAHYENKEVLEAAETGQGPKLRMATKSARVK